MIFLRKTFIVAKKKSLNLATSQLFLRVPFKLQNITSHT